MNIATYAGRNLFRRKGRTILTVIAMGFAIFGFAFIRTALVSWAVGGDDAQQDRLVSRHRVSFTMSMPMHYIDEVRQVDGVAGATWANWFGAKDPLKRVDFFAGFAVDKDSFFEISKEMSVDPKELADWKATKNGVIIGEILSEKLQAPVGSIVRIESDIYPGNWEFKVCGIYKALRKTVDKQSLILRWDMLNDDPRAAWGKNTIGWMQINIKDPNKGPEISKAIDKHFEEKDDQTLTMSERDFQLSFVGAFAAVLKALGYVSIGILLVMMLILANTIAMNVRERAHEYGVLRAIGFPPGHILGFIIGEAMLVGLVGGLVGMLFTHVFVNLGLGPVIESQGFFPVFKAPGWLMLVSLALATLGGLIAGVLPAIGASRRKVTDALRRVD